VTLPAKGPPHSSVLPRGEPVESLEKTRGPEVPDRFYS